MISYITETCKPQIPLLQLSCAGLWVALICHTRLKYLLIPNPLNKQQNVADSVKDCKLKVSPGKRMLLWVRQKCFEKVWSFEKCSTCPGTLPVICTLLLQLRIVFLFAFAAQYVCLYSSIKMNKLCFIKRICPSHQRQSGSGDLNNHFFWLLQFMIPQAEASALWKSSKHIPCKE